jgi:glycosyltransferase involved in cell wall biosynthesis
MPLPKASRPLISIVIPTHNRAELLDQTLRSFARQTLASSLFEIIVVDDGSLDSTRQVVEAWENHLPVRTRFQPKAGIAAAKNLGLSAADAPLLLFFDDDDLATPDLLKAHLKSHQRYPAETIAVLNYTTWQPGLKITPLMHFITHEGGLLFSYPQIRHGQFLDFTFFWGGRASCKKSMLTKYGVFNPDFRFGNEDVELGYRLAPQGFQVVFNRKAVSFMNRPVTFDDFVERCLKQGKANFIWGAGSDDPWVREWCLLDHFNQEAAWNRAHYEALLDYTRKLDRLAKEQIAHGLPLSPEFRKTLFESYGETFRACKIKGAAVERQSRGFAGKPNNSKTFLIDQVPHDFKVVAVICAFNEEDVIYHSLRHLIDNGVAVYLLDHHSTDRTVEEASRWLGQGLLHIEIFPEESGFPDEYQSIFSLGSITRRVEQLHRELGADWFMHYDADEFRESPWPGMTLREAFRLVDTLGFNAVNFEYLNFWPTEDNYLPGQDVRDFIHYYEPATELDKPRINAWKNFGQAIDLTTFMGHKVCFEELKVFPLQFINRHYRIRSQKHGLKKVFQERTNRFDPTEKSAGSHLHYDGWSPDFNFIKDKKELCLYDAARVRKELWFKSAFNAGKYR